MAKKKKEGRNIPIGVRIISVIYYVGACLLGILGLIAFVLAGSGQVIPEFMVTGVLGTAVLGVVFIGLGALYYFIGRALWKGRKWAKVLVLILTIVSIIDELITLFTAGFSVIIIIMMIVNIAILYYLVFDKKSKAFFK